MPSTTTPTTNGEGYGHIDDFDVPTVDLKTNGRGASTVPTQRHTGNRVSGGHAASRRQGEGDLFSGIGRGLRFLAGVDETLMDKVRWERSSYASLGGIVLATAIIAAFSMWFAVNEAANINPWWALMPAAIWFVFIVIVDRWIVTTRPTGAWQRWVLLFSRAFLALLFGIVIAEPLVLRVFQTQVEDQVRADRAQNLSLLETNLKQCNPDPADTTAPPTPADCVTDGYVLAISTDPSAQKSQITELQTQVDTLRGTISDETKQLAALDNTARDECLGHKGLHVTGQFGDGPFCEQDKTIAHQYADAHPIATQQQQLASLESQLAIQEGGATTTRKEFVELRATKIEERLRAEPQVNAPIGLLERMAALAKLGAGNATLLTGIILVRMLFITIDCAPVLMKMTSGKSSYDELVASSLDDAIKTHRIVLEGKDSERAMELENQEQARRDHAIVMQQRRADAVEARAAAYERQAMATESD